MTGVSKDSTFTLTNTPRAFSGTIIAGSGAQAGQIRFQANSPTALGTATVITSNRAVDEWVALFDDPILANSALDRFAHRAHQIVMDGPVREIFRRAQDLTALGLGVPAITALMLRLRSAGMAVTPDVLTVDEARAAIGKVLQWN